MNKSNKNLFNAKHQIMNKREFLKTGLLMGAAATVVPSIFKNNVYGSSGSKSTLKSGSEFIQYPLPFAFSALEPNIDTQTMEIHYTKHHAAYTKKFNDAVKDEKLEGLTTEEIFAGVEKYSAAIRNNGGGYYNHNFFWQTLSPSGGAEPAGELLKEIEKNFGGFAAFKESFTKAATSVFGSGWAWLVKQEGSLKIISTPNQDNPLMSISKEKGTPLMCLDVWEHAYYLKYQNKRADYISAFWNVVNWNFVSGNLLR
jgi:superoxide dismutase, Fe-Mn family